MDTPVAVRRNGKRPSCEPCRISKLSCDHQVPCARCKRRKIESRCFIHAAPMTGLKPRTPQQASRNRTSSASQIHPAIQSEARAFAYDGAGPWPASPGTAPSPRTDVHPIRPWESETPSTDRSLQQQASPSTAPIPSHTSWPRNTGTTTSSTGPSAVLTPNLSSPATQSTNEWAPAAGLTRTGQGPTSGYLGSTSFSAVFDEKIGIVGGAGGNDQNGFSESNHHVERLSSQEHDQRIKEGAAILAQLVDFKHLVPLLDKWLEYARYPTLVGPFTLPCAEAVQRDFVSKQLTPQELLALSEKLLHNSTRPLKVPSNCKLSEYHHLFTGPNMRWEQIALMFTAAGLSAILLGPADPLLSFLGSQLPADKLAFVRRMVQLGSSCLNFCTDVGHLNDFGIWILHEHCLLISQILGDAHYLTWRRFGDLATALFAMGLHQDIKESPDVPFWLTEFRRRSGGIIYGIDKMMSVFLGRPPRISQRYCSVNIPLDLEFDDLASDGPELARKLAQIDPATGWNSDGAMRKSTYTRCFVLINRVREDILELSLGRASGSTTDDDVAALGADIARRNEQVWNDFPKSHKYYPEIWTGKRTADDCVTTVIIYLDIVYNEFLLQRTLVRRVRAPSESLVRISRLLLSTCIAVVNNRSHLGTVGCDAAWIVVLYGLPASGVLALELLQQQQQQTQNRGGGAQMMGAKDFPRSEVIQNLSVFVACLGWIHLEGDGNYHLCIQARDMIQRILDRVLSPESAFSSQQEPTPAATSNSDYNADEAMYDFSWMDNAQFDVDFWSNLDFHPLLAMPEP